MTFAESLSRRKLLRDVSAVSLGAGLMGATGAAQTPPSAGGLLGARVYNIRDFGAKGDGTSLDTVALQSAIDACHKDLGGTVLVPAGVFVIGTVELKSNVTVHISAQGKLLGSADGKQYHAADAIPLRGDSTLGDGNVGLLYAVGAENVTIEGNGTIDGQGAQFRSPERGFPPPSGRGGAQRPYHLLFHQCKNLTVRDITLLNSAFHSIRVIQSSYVKMEGLHIRSRVNHNNDGFHFISCERVHVNNCDVECQDDACALFGSNKWVTVTGCSFSTRWSVFRFGGGNVEYIAVSNCVIYETFGCPIKIRCGPGDRFENMSFSNLIMDRVTGPISIGVGPRGERIVQPGAAPPPPNPNRRPESMEPAICRNISFSNIHANVIHPEDLPETEFTSRYNPGEVYSCMALNGIGGVFEKISFDNVHVTFAGGGSAEQAAVRNVPKANGEYYEAGVYPAYGLYARNVKGVTLSNVRLEVATPDLRPAMVFDHVEDVAVNGFSAQGDKEAESLVRIIDSKDVLMSASRVLSPVPVFARVEGAANQGITIDGGDLSKATTPVTLAGGATKTSVKTRI